MAHGVNLCRMPLTNKKTVWCIIFLILAASESQALEETVELEDSRIIFDQPARLAAKSESVDISSDVNSGQKRFLIQISGTTSKEYSVLGLISLDGPC